MQSSIFQLFLLQEAIEFYKSVRRHVPQGIVIFRDGVSEGEFEKVGRNEIEIIEGEHILLVVHASLNFGG